MKIVHSRIQQPVGQGGFHTASVEIDFARFDYVYDCGSDNPPTGKKKGAKKRHTELAEQYIASLGHRRIGALFISHFDSDHVNGLPDLLAKPNNAPEWVFLPYLTPIERLAIAGRYAEVSDADTLNPEMQVFLANPAAWLIQKGCSNVIYVYGNGPDEEGGSGPILPEPPPDSARPESSREERLRLKVFDSNTPPTNQQVASIDTGAGISFMSHRDAVQMTGSISVHWIFTTYCDRDWKGLPNIESLVKEALGEEEFKAIRTNSGDLASILADSKKLSALRQAYKKAATGNKKNGKYMNWSSLAVHSMPSLVHKFLHSPIIVESRALLDRKYLGSHDNLGGWLGTGDAELGRPDVEKRFLTHFQKARLEHQTIDLLRHVGTAMIPHHGSRHNFSEGLLRAIPRPLAVVPVGWASKHGHPSLKVVLALQGRYAHVYVHDLLNSGLEERIEYYVE